MLNIEIKIKFVRYWNFLKFQSKEGVTNLFEKTTIAYQIKYNFITHTETEISAKTETESFRSLVNIDF